MTSGDVLERYRESGALQEGHFVLSSGRHSSRYFQSALVLADPVRAAELGRALAARLPDRRIDVVIGPAMGGILVAHELARALGCLSMFAERAEGGFALRRGFALRADDRCLIAEDVLTTGRSVRELAPALAAAGATLAGIACLVDRRESTAGLEWPVVSLLELAIPTWDPAGCPLCRESAPLTRPGSRR